MESIISKARNEKGSVLVISLILIALLTLIGVMGITTTQTETQITGNDMFRKIAFYDADAGVYATPKLISACIGNGAEQSEANITYLGSAGTFYREIMGFDSHDSANDIRFILAGNKVDVDVNRTHQESLAGGGVEFASGAEGMGVGSTGGVAIFYEMDSFGDGPANSASNIGATYRKVIGVAGGL